MKYFEKKRKLIHFLEDWWRIDKENGGFVSENGVFRRGRGGQDNETTRDARENWKVFENYLEFNPICAKHVFFATRMSCEQVTRSSRQNPMWQNLKNFSNCFLRLEGPLASKSWWELWSILSKLVIRASTCEPVVKWVAKILKPTKFENFLSLFHDWGLNSPENHESFWVSSQLGSRDWIDPREWVANIELHSIWNFENFQNKNTFQKQLKYSKIFLCLISIWLS